MSKVKFALITSCSSTRVIDPEASVENLDKGLDMQAAMNQWLKLLDDAPTRTTPVEQYRGLGFHTLANIRNKFEPVETKIITGGLGFTDIDEEIPPYDFSANKNEEHNILQHVTAEPFSQVTWWRMINKARHKSETPVADFLEYCSGNNIKVVVSLGKVFLRYIADDFLSASIEAKQNVRILLSASSVGSVPAQLRPYIIPFDRGVIAHIPGNRNDTNHRATLHFLERASRDDEWWDKPITDLRTFFIDPEQGARQKLDLTKLFRERPDLLKLTSDQAYKVVRREHGTFGGKMYFNSAFRVAQGHSLDVQENDIDEAAKQLQSLGLGFLTSNAQNNGSKKSDEDDSLKKVKVFVEAVRRLNASAVFTAADICSWADQTKDNTELPNLMTSPNKLAILVKNNTELLGIEEVNADTGGKYYRIAN